MIEILSELGSLFVRLYVGASRPPIPKELQHIFDKIIIKYILLVMFLYFTGSTIYMALLMAFIFFTVMIIINKITKYFKHKHKRDGDGDVENDEDLDE